MSFRISVFSSAELQATILLLKGMDRELAKQIRAAIKTVTQAEWQESVRANVVDRVQTRVLSDTARVAVSDQNITLKSATIGRSMSGGAKPSDIWAAVEFGVDQHRVSSYKSTSKTGKTFRVYKRHSVLQFRPFRKGGRVVYPAVADLVPRIASLFVQTTVRTFHELIEKGS